VVIEATLPSILAKYDTFADLSTTVNILDLLQSPRAVVSGDPGSGKSTLTRYITWAICAGATELVGEDLTAYLPVRIRAVEFAEALDRGSADTLAGYLLQTMGDPYAPLLAQRLVTGQAFVLLDGLDEIATPALRERLKEQVDDFAADPHFSHNRILITTRIVGYQRTGLTGRFPHYTLAALDDKQIAAFVEKWYRAIQNEMPNVIDVERERQQLLDAVMGKPSIQRMARNPLLLTIIALIKWQGRTLPEQRVLLYDAAVQTLIRSWPLTQRRVELDELFIREWLAPVALHMLERGESDLLDEYSLMELLVKSMKGLKSVTDFEAKRDSQALLADVALHSGILLPRGSDEDGRELYGFLHQTMAEYLAAYCLAGRWEDGELDLLDYAHVPYWREVLLLMAGHLGTQRRAKAGNFLQSILALEASPYEPYMRRNLLLAARILADGVPVGPGSLVESILTELFKLWQETPISSLRDEVEAIFAALGSTEYAVVLARLVGEAHLSSNEFFKFGTYLDGPPGTEFLRSLLQDEDANLRYQVAAALTKRGDRQGVDGLLALLQDGDSEIRHRAVAALVNRDEPGVEEELLALLQDRDKWVRHWAAEGLAKRGNRQGTEGLHALLQDEDVWARYRAAEALAKRGDPQGVEGLLILLNHEDSGVRYHATEVFANHSGSRVEEGLRALLHDKDARFRVAEALPKRNYRSEIERLLAQLQDDNPMVRYQAAGALAKQDNSRGIEGLVALLQEKDTKVRYWAAETLAKRGLPQGLEAMLVMLQDEDVSVRHRAAVVLADRDDLRGKEGLVALLQHQDVQVRLKAAVALADRDDPRGTEGLITLLQEKNAMVRVQAAAALAHRDDPRGVEGLVALLQYRNARIRYRAAEALIKRNDPQCISAIWRTMRKLLQDTDPGWQLSSGQSKSVADVAYDFLRKRLGPRGEELI
jgi:HEAT repeat protein